MEKWYHDKWLANKTLKFLLERNRSIAHLVPSTVYKNYLFLDLLPLPTRRLRVIYPHFDFAFLFDHSQGHAKKLANGLDAYSMNKGYGGAQPRMRESIIKENDGYLGMHLSTVSVGDTQLFIFEPGDDGPLWMPEEQRQLNRHDRILSPRPGNLTT
jgi:hypothetical protein